ncbi:MAG: lanthionine synthetase LanC family protein [Ktedonobacteraceae bacterium]
MHTSPDVFHGTAGRLLFHLLLWDETADPAQLQAAATAGNFLVEQALWKGNEECFWIIPPGYDSLSGNGYLGYAHGAAGIANILLDLFSVTGDKRFFRTAQGASRWLLRQAIPTLSNDSGLAWPDVEGKAINNTFWCHGATGVGQFFLHAVSYGVLPEAADLAERAAHTTARGTRWASPSQCHGLAGSIEFLLDMYQATGTPAYLNEADALAKILEAFRIEREGKIVLPSEDPTTITPDYMIGYADVAICLLRLSEPMKRPRQLSRAGFQYR